MYPDNIKHPIPTNHQTPTFQNHLKNLIFNQELQQNSKQETRELTVLASWPEFCSELKEDIGDERGGDWNLCKIWKGEQERAKQELNDREELQPIQRGSNKKGNWKEIGFVLPLCLSITTFCVSFDNKILVWHCWHVWDFLIKCLCDMKIELAKNDDEGSDIIGVNVSFDHWRVLWIVLV